MGTKPFVKFGVSRAAAGVAARAAAPVQRVNVQSDEGRRVSGDQGD
jgi:hypothetical protein